MSLLESRLAQLMKERQTQSRLRQLKSTPAGSIDLSSNDFLSLATSCQFQQDFLAELHKTQLPVGSTGSRLLDGNSQYAELLERDIAGFHRAETGLLTNSGFDANVSIFMCLPQPGDVIVYDELIHASVHDGMRQSRASTTVSFKHNSVTDLERVLRKFVNIERERNIFVAVESVYSMDGDLAPLAEIAALLKEMCLTDNCHLIVDEAHATGVYGARGRGRVSELGLEAAVLVRLHTFGKALGCNGAIILCSHTIKQYLINYARPLIYTTFMSYASLSAIRVAYDWLSQGRTDKLRTKLSDLIAYLHQELQALPRSRVFDSHIPILQVPPLCPQSPIFALVTPRPRQLASYCQERGFVVRAVVPPTVPEGTDRVRVCVHAGNTKTEIDRFVECVRTWLEMQDTLVENGSSSNPPTPQGLPRNSSNIEKYAGHSSCAGDGDGNGTNDGDSNRKMTRSGNVNQRIPSHNASDSDSDSVDNVDSASNANSQSDNDHDSTTHTWTLKLPPPTPSRSSPPRNQKAKL